MTEAPARFRCLCGRIHSLDRGTVMDRVAQDHWRCTHCARIFVLVHEPPGTFTPVFVDGNSRPQVAFDTGPGAPPAEAGRPEPPPALEFRCRCGRRMTAHSWMYGGPMDCGGCGTPMLLVLKFNPRRNWHVIEPEYPTDSTSLKALQARKAAPAPRPAERRDPPRIGSAAQARGRA